MSYQTLTSYFPRALALPFHSTLQKLAKIPWSMIRRFYNAEIAEALRGAIEHHFAAFVRAIAEMQRAPRRASLGAVMDELAWDADMGDECWDEF